MGFAARWARGARRWRWAIIVLWLVVSVCGYVWGLKFLDCTVSDFPAPAKSAALEAEAQLSAYFPSLQSKVTETLLLRTLDGSSVADGHLRGPLARFCRDYHASVQARFGEGVEVVSYYMLAPYVPDLAAPLLSLDASATTVVVSYAKSKSSDKEHTAFLRFLLDEARRLLDAAGLGGQVSAGLTGLGAFALDINTGVKHDAATMDSLVLPLALLILATVVRSLPLMLVPLLTIPVTLLGQMLIMYPVALSVDVVSFAPTVMISLTIAMGIDYSLFCLTRFMDGVRARLSLTDAVTLMIESAGYIILVSGSTLCVSFLGLVLLPMEILKSMGLGSAVAIATALLVNLTLVPALLFTAGPYLLKADRCLARSFKSLTARCFGRGKADESPSGELKEPLLSLEEDPKEGGERRPSLEEVEQRESIGVAEDGEQDHPPRGCWLNLARFLTANRWRGVAILVGTLAIFIPGILQLLRLKASVEFDLMLPYGSGSFTTLDDITRSFGGPGVVFPYRLVMVDRASREGGLLSEDGFEAMGQAVGALVSQVPRTRLEDLMGLPVLGGSAVGWAEMAAALNTTALPGTRAFTLQALASGPASVVSTDGRATFLTVALEMDPYSSEGQSWLEDARRVLSAQQGPLQLSLYLEGPAGVIHDGVEAVLESFPTMISITLAVVFGLIGLAYKSVVAPFRSVITISLTLAFVYGMAVAVYQDGILDWTGWRALSKVGSIAWLPLVMCFSIIVGLGLDYDVFLVTRVLEYRLEGHTDRSALISGMVSTGHIITCAGVIMAVAFSGLLFSAELALNQTAFLLCGSVLLDTFVVRTLLVPILMTFTDRFTWWPRRDLPTPQKDYDPTR